jgi:hypothetical protein
MILASCYLLYRVQALDKHRSQAHVLYGTEAQLPELAISAREYHALLGQEQRVPLAERRRHNRYLLQCRDHIRHV